MIKEREPLTQQAYMHIWWLAGAVHMYIHGYVHSLVSYIQNGCAQRGILTRTLILVLLRVTRCRMTRLELIPTVCRAVSRDTDRHKNNCYLSGWDSCSVTRLGECSPVGWLFSLSSLLIISELAHTFWECFFYVFPVKLRINFDEKMRWATFWAIY
jgi:hypothetical protein